MYRLITVPQLAEILAKQNAATFVTFTALTEPEMRKTGNPYAGKVRKLSRVNGVIGDYESAVNRQLAREGNAQLHFTAQPRKWGVHVSRALVEHKGGFYLSSRPLHSRPFWLLLTDIGLMPVAKAMFDQWVPPYRPPTNQGTEKAIEPRDYALDNIASLSMNGERFRVRH